MPRNCPLGYQAQILLKVGYLLIHDRSGSGLEVTALPIETRWLEYWPCFYRRGGKALLVALHGGVLSHSGYDQ